MSELIVLLRGVNVGKGNRVPMAEFKALLETLGYEQVRTLLNSGNAICRGPGANTVEMAGAIAHELHARLGITTPVIVKTRAQLQQIIRENPIAVPEPEYSRYLVAFGADALAVQSLQPLLALNSANDQLVLSPQAGYLYCKAGLLESAIGKAMVGKVGRQVTTRNWATVLKLAALFEQ